LILDENAFDHPVVVKTQHEFVRIVRRGEEVPFHAGGEHRERRGEFSTQPLRQIGHVLERGRPVSQNLLANLVDPHRRLTPFGEPGAQFLGWHIQNARQRGHLDGWDDRGGFVDNRQFGRHQPILRRFTQSGKPL